MKPFVVPSPLELRLLHEDRSARRWRLFDRFMLVAIIFLTGAVAGQVAGCVARGLP